MSLHENWMGPDELRAIADYCDTLAPLWDALTSGPKGGVTIDSEGIKLGVYDANGERLGRISWSDGGPAFFLAASEQPGASA